MRVCVLGAGYVGLVTGACLAASGHGVRVLDVDLARVETLQGGQSPIYEPGLDDLVRSGIASGNLVFDAMPRGLEKAEIIVVAVGTPSTAMGAADLSYVRSAMEEVAHRAARGTTVVMKSTVPPGTGASLSANYLEGTGIGYVSNPEFLREGNAISDWFNTDRVVIGATDPDLAEAVRALYAGIDTVFLECDVNSAEMIKYASNAFLATKISFINEVARLCDRVGANVQDVARGLGLDSRIGASFLNAGIGYGGSCFPKDTRALDYLSASNGYDFHLLKAVIEVNARQRLLPVMVLTERLGKLVGAEIAVLGLTFKPGTDDTRESPGLDVARMLAVEGASVRGHDPIGVVASEHGFVQAESIAEALRGADACVVAVEWPDYADIAWSDVASLMRAGAVVFDGRNCLDRSAIETAGLEYIGVGVP